MDDFIFEIPVEAAIKKIKNSNLKNFSLSYNEKNYKISLTETAKVVANNPKCCFCGAEATRAFVCENNGKYGIKFFTEKNGELILFTKDHKKPRSAGGADRFKNYQTSCEICNRLKGDISKNNKISQSVIQLREKVLEQRKELSRLSEQNRQLKNKNNNLEKELNEIYSIRFIRIYLSIKNSISVFLDKHI